MKTIKLAKSIVGELEKNALNEVIDNAYLGMGSYVQKFEQDLKSYLNAAHVICVNSGTAALHLAVLAADIGQGDEVLIQSLTFVASFQAVSAAGATPVACEILPGDATIDLRDAEMKLTPRTKAIMPVHYGGRVGDLDKVYEFARKHKLRVIEDAAHAFGTVYNGKKIGSFGDIACFSFDGIKNITSGEGGAVVTSDPKIAQRVMDARLLGVQKDTEKRYKGQRSWEFDVTHQGFRYHMSNLFAAIGLVQLGRFENEFKPKRQAIAKMYHKKLENIGTIGLFSGDYDKVVPHIFPVKILSGKRDGLRQVLLDKNVECGIHYYPNHLLSYYRRNGIKLPVTEKVYSELLSLPLHPEITESDVEYITGAIAEYL